MAVDHDQDLLAGAGPDPANFDHEGTKLVNGYAEARHHLQHVHQSACPHVPDIVGGYDGCRGRGFTNRDWSFGGGDQFLFINKHEQFFFTGWAVLSPHRIRWKSRLTCPPNRAIHPQQQHK